MKLILDLTAKEVELLRNCTSDLGTNDIHAVRLRLKIANAILDVPNAILDVPNAILDKEPQTFFPKRGC